MSCRRETAAARVYRFCPEDPPPAATDRERALLRARLIDEITLEPVTVDVTATTTTRGVTARSAPFGRIGLVGRPARLYPDLDVASVPLDLRVDVPGYLPLDASATLGPVLGFPDAFLPRDLGDLALHRLATVLRGRTLRRSSLVPTAVAGADVRVLGFWPTFPPPSVSPAAVMQAPNLVALAPGFYTSRASGATTVRRRGVTPVPGRDKRLLAPAPSGTRRLRLTDRDAIAVGTVLIVHADGPGRREWIPVAHVETSSAPDQPAWATLEHPLAYTQRVGVLCQVGALQPPGPVATLSRSAVPGDETAFLSGLASLVSGDVVEIDDVVSPPEFHEVRLYEALSDADGYFRLPPISRVAMVLVRALRAGLVSPSDARVAPEYRVRENRLTVLFP